MKPLQGTEAERRVEQVLRAGGWVTHRAVAHRVQLGCPKCDPVNSHGFTKAYDVWGSIDIMAKHRRLGVWAVQVTCQDTAADGTPHGSGMQNVTARRRKIDQDDSWPLEMLHQVVGADARLRVSIIETRVRPAPKGTRARREDYGRVHDLTPEGGWQVWGEIVLPKPDQLKRAAKRADRQARLRQLDLVDPIDPNDPPM
jgi:hypothetical protein